ncbi:MAG TPA: hypothetical protein VG389_24335 [Myxococcota bacterium]|jgi:hypothetical protein|nr:hypothetical protein [Myxococcota bacterium]
MSYGFGEAREIVRQGSIFIEAAAAAENASARAKLDGEGYGPGVHAAGEQLLGDAQDALAGSEGALGLLKGASEVQDDAFDALADELSRRLRKTRAKLGESEANEFLLTGLNAAVRAAGRSQAAVPARARAFLAAVQAPHEDPDTGASVTIAERVEVTAEQIATLQQKLEAFLDADTHQEGRKGGRIQLTEAKERKVRALDRWLAKWQQIAKADFTAAELATFGVPHNVHAARGRVRRRTPAPPSSGPTSPASGT